MADRVRSSHTLLQATAVADRWGTENFATINGVFTELLTVAALASLRS